MRATPRIHIGEREREADGEATRTSFEDAINAAHEYTNSEHVDIYILCARVAGGGVRRVPGHTGRGVGLDSAPPHCLLCITAAAQVGTRWI